MQYRKMSIFAVRENNRGLHLHDFKEKSSQLMNAKIYTNLKENLEKIIIKYF